MTLLRELSWYFKQQWKRYLASMLMLAIVAVLNLVAPWLVGTLVDRIAQNTLTYQDLLHTVMLLLVVSIIIYVLRYLWRLSLYSASYRLGSLLRQQLYQHWLEQPASFFNIYGTGDLMARATNDVTAVEMSAGEAILALFDGVLVGCMVLGVLFLAIDWRLAALTLIPWPMMAYSFWKINNQLHRAFTDAQARFGDLNDQTLEHINGIRLLRAYGLERRAGLQFALAAEKAQAANLKVAATEAKYEPVIFITMGLSFLIALGCGSWFIIQNQLTVGELTRFTLYLGQLIWPMFAYGWLLNLLERGRVAYQRIRMILGTASAIEYRQDSEPLPIKDTTLTWDVQCFNYPNHSKPALQSFTGQLAPGKTIGVVGTTGSGKSTFVELLGRLYESSGVSISLGDNPITHLTKQELRRLIAFVPQEAFLFSTTIADNIALGNPLASSEEIEQAANLAVISEDIKRFPKGFETPVGEKGVTLSGGQKQRIAIARLMLVDAPIVVLDDALSAVDVATEKKILKNFKQVSLNRSTLIVSHRLSAVEHADEIIVLKDGIPIERGNHQALLALNGWYADMYRYQKLEQVVEEGR